MELTDPIIIWGSVGLLLMLAELIIPGGIVILLGGACLIVALSLGIGLVEGIAQSLTLWFIVSIIFLLGFRQVTQKIVGGDSHVGNTDEELDIYNQIALVKEAIGPAQHPGRIEFQGTEWSALGDGSEIAVGAEVRIICRENIGLIVEPIKHAK